MPWNIEERDSKYCVIKESDGEVAGCHDTEAEAQDQLAALYASEEKDTELPILSPAVEKSILQRLKTFVDTLLSPTEPDFSVHKDASGTWRFDGIYSTAEIDRDGETLTPESHKSFSAMVECGAVPYPTLLPWHVKSLPMGQADLISYDDSTQQAHVSGYWYPDFYPIAEQTSKLKGLGMSHGMPRLLIDRQPDDPTQIIRYVSSEVTFLPRDAAANLGTRFTILKEDTMALKEDQVKFLKEIGLPDEYLTRLQEATKEVELTVEKETEEVEKTPVEATPVEPIPEPTPDPIKSTPDPNAEIIDALKGLGELIGQLGLAVKSTNARLDTLEKEESERLKTVVADTPPASLREMIMSSIIGKDATLVDGRSSLVKSAPAEPKPDTNRTGIPLIEALKSGKDWRTALAIEETNPNG